MKNDDIEQDKTTQGMHLSRKARENVDLQIMTLQRLSDAFFSTGNHSMGTMLQSVANHLCDASDDMDKSEGMFISGAGEYVRQGTANMLGAVLAMSPRK